MVLTLSARPVAALAVFYDGTSGSQTAVRRWVQNLHPCEGGRFAIDEGDVLTVTEPWGDGQVRLCPGHYLVFAQGGPCCWTVVSPGQFDTWLEHRPWEMPIFPDGEVVS